VVLNIDDLNPRYGGKRLGFIEGGAMQRYTTGSSSDGVGAARVYLMRWSFDRRNPEMKHLISSVTIGACLLLSSAGAVFAANPHLGPAHGAGQLGTGGTGAASCGGAQASPQGQVMNPNTNSPFPTGLPPGPSPNYAGAGPNPKSNGTPPPNSNGPANYGAGTTGVANMHANSQYDNACLRQMP
jgi:hypothetical protein